MCVRDLCLESIKFHCKRVENFSCWKEMIILWQLTFRSDSALFLEFEFVYLLLEDCRWEIFILFPDDFLNKTTIKVCLYFWKLKNFNAKFQLVTAQFKQIVAFPLAKQCFILGRCRRYNKWQLRSAKRNLSCFAKLSCKENFSWCTGKKIASNFLQIFFCVKFFSVKI